MKGYRFKYIETATHEAVVYADDLEEAEDKLENFKADKDKVVECEIDFRETELVETWEE